MDYDLVNTEGEIRRTIGREKASPARDSSHGEAIAEFINLISSNSALIVIGYAGWEDAIMKTLEAVLSNSGFPAGIFWCCRGKSEDLRANVQSLHEQVDHMYIVENCTALDVMRAALEASGIQETTVVERARNVGLELSENFEKRWVQIEHDRHGFKKPCLSLEERQDRVRLPDPESILEKIARAALDSRNTRLALEFVGAALRRADRYPRPIQARLFQGRADLLSRSSPQIELAISDYHWALRLGTDRKAEAWLSLRECYRNIGDEHYASLALRRAYRLACKEGPKVATGLCQLTSGIRLYDGNKLKKATARIESSAKIFEQEGRLDLRAECHYQLGALMLFNNQPEQAMAKAQLTKDDSRTAGYRVGESEAEFLRGQIYVYLNQLDRAQESLEWAFNIAQEGPHFKLLGDISLFWADLSMKAGNPASAIAMEEEAMRLYGLSGRTKGYATAKVLRDIYRIHGEPRRDPALFKAAGESAGELEDCGDKSVSVVMWATLGAACLLKDDVSDSADLAKHAIKRCRKLAADFAAEIGKIAEDGPLGFKDPDSRLNAHVQEYATLFELLTILRKEAAAELQSEIKRYIRKKYHEFRSNHAVYEYASPESEVLAAIVSFLIFRKGLYSFKELVSFDSVQRENQLTPEALRTFCKQKGFWQYEGFLN